MGRNPVTGRSRYVTKTVRGGKREAQRELVVVLTRRPGIRRYLELEVAARSSAQLVGSLQFRHELTELYRGKRLRLGCAA